MFARTRLLLVLALTACATTGSGDGVCPTCGQEVPGKTTAAETAVKEEVVFPQPLSAHVAMRKVLDIIEEHRARDRSIECRAIHADYVIGRAGKPDVGRVKLDLSFFAESDLVATKHYADLRRAFQESPWCTEVGTRATSVLEGDSGIYIDGLEITALPPAIDRPTSLSEDSAGGSTWDLDNPELYVRGMANHNRVKLGQVNTRTSQLQIGGGVVDDRIEIRPSQQDRAYALQQVLNFLVLLEQESDCVVVTGIKLLPATKVRPHEHVEDRWCFEAETTIRRHAE